MQCCRSPTRLPVASRLLLLALLALCGCKQQLYSSLSERDANEMIAVLASRGLQADKVAAEKGDFKIELDRSDFSAAIEALRNHGLPRAKYASIGEVFKKDGLVTTANAERLRFMYAMSDELSRTLSMIDGVVEARVHPVLPGGDPLTDKLTPASASVFIKHTPDANLTLLAPAIKDLVVSSIEGLSYDKVSLTFVPASKIAGSSTIPEIAAAASSSLLSPSSIGIGLAAVLLSLGILLFFLRGRAEDADPPPEPLVRPTQPRTESSLQSLGRRLRMLTPAGRSAAAASAVRARNEARDSAARTPAAEEGSAQSAAVVSIDRKRHRA